MSLNVSVRSLVCAGLALIIIAASGAPSFSQRPRYSSPQYGERSWTVPSGTVISARMDSNLNSRTSRVGDRFSATVTIPVYVNGKTVIPAGSTIEGRVTQVTPAKRKSKSGTIAVDFDELIFPNGTRLNLNGGLTAADPQDNQTIDDEGNVTGEARDRTAVFVGGGSIAGAVLGGIAGGAKGAVLGGIAGAGAGVAGVLLSKGAEAEVPPGTPFGIHLNQPLEVRESFISEDRMPRDPDPYADRESARGRQPVLDRGDRDRDPDRDTTVAQPADTVDAARPAPDADRVEPAAASLPLSSPEMVRRAQIALKEQGYYEGQADGVMSVRTSNALRTYQSEHGLPQTGDLDPDTARSLGITVAARAGSTNSGATNTGVTNSSPSSAGSRRAERSPAAGETVLANVLSATAYRTPDGAISVTINTQANTGGWRWFEDHVINADTLEVYARAVRPTGIVTQALTRGRIDMSVRDGVDFVRRVVVHGAGGDTAITLGSGGDTSNALGLQRQAEDLLSQYQRLIGVRLTGSGVEFSNRGQHSEPEIELLFALDGFANASQLYARLVPSLQDPDGLRGATLALAREARKADRLFTTTSIKAADSLASRWDAIRQDVLKLMRAYNISSTDLDN